MDVFLPLAACGTTGCSVFRFDSLQTTTTNHLYICRRFNSRYFVRCTSSIHFKLRTLLQAEAARLRRYAGRCSLRLWRQSTFAYCSQGLWVPQIFTAPVYRAHYAVIFAIAQLSCLFYDMTSLTPSLCFFHYGLFVYRGIIEVGIKKWSLCVEKFLTGTYLASYVRY